MKDSKEEMVEHIGRPYLASIGFIQLVFLLMLIASLILWMWFEWSVVWRMGLTGIIGMGICKIIYVWIKKIVREVIEKEQSKDNGKTE